MGDDLRFIHFVIPAFAGMTRDVLREYRFIWLRISRAMYLAYPKIEPNASHDRRDACHGKRLVTVSNILAVNT